MSVFKKLMGATGGNSPARKSNEEMSIGTPTNVIRNFHAEHDANKGVIVGLPPEMLNMFELMTTKVQYFWIHKSIFLCFLDHFKHNQHKVYHNLDSKDTVTYKKSYFEH